MRKTSRIAALIICLLLGFASLKAQKTIYGKVLDKKDQYPIPGVNVIVLPDSSSGTVTNLSGEFTINVSDSSELVFSTAGYEKLRLPVEKSDTIFVELKMRCFRDFFDGKDIFIGLQSGLFYNYFGLDLEIAVPLYIKSITPDIGLQYQSNFNNTRFIEARAMINHLLVECEFDLDVNGYYRENKFMDVFSSQIYTLEADLNFSDIWHSQYLEISLGPSFLNFMEPENQLNQFYYGANLGLGYWINKPFNTFLSFKGSFFKTFQEYQVDLSKKIFKRIRGTISYYDFSTFTEISLGMKYEFSY